jgi:hypothetical protein
MAVAQEAEGHGSDRPDVARHVLARDAVAPGRAADENAPLVDEADREAVELGLGRVLDLFDREPFAHPAVEGGKLFLTERVVHGQHRGRVAHARERLGRGRADALGGRIRAHQLGMPPLERLELPEQAVVRRIRDRRAVEDVVAVVVLADPAPQLADAERDASARLPAHSSVVTRGARSVAGQRAHDWTRADPERRPFTGARLCSRSPPIRCAHAISSVAGLVFRTAVFSIQPRRAVATPSSRFPRWSRMWVSESIATTVPSS